MGSRFVVNLASWFDNQEDMALTPSKGVEGGLLRSYERSSGEFNLLMRGLGDLAREGYHLRVSDLPAASRVTSVTLLKSAMDGWVELGLHEGDKLLHVERFHDTSPLEHSMLGLAGCQVAFRY